MRSLLNIGKWFLVFATSLWLLWFAVSWAMYRIPVDHEEDVLAGEVHYKFLELGLTNRAAFEDLLGNRIVRLEGQPTLYAPASEKAKLLPENPHEMWDKKYSLRAKLRAKRLLFGGYGIAEIVSIERLEKEPILSK